MSAPSGGVWDKLGNSYEAVWTVDRMIDVFLRQYASITPEPPGDEAIGIEFVLKMQDGAAEYHSVKRQTQKKDWSVATLCGTSPKTGRSILGDLFDKLIVEPAAKLVFVSSTGANHLLQITERAQHQATYRALRDSLSQTLQPQLTNRLYPLCGNDEDRTLASLQALEVISRTQLDLIRSVDQRIDLHFYRKDGALMDAGDVRRRLHEYAMNHLGETLTTEMIRTHLDESGYGNRDWRTDQHILDLVDKLNERYRSVVETELINGAQLTRTDTKTVVEHLREPNTNGVMLVAPGGFGKSCVLAQSVCTLLSDGVPTIVLRMDSMQPCSTSRQLGHQLDLPASPAVALAGIADNAESVLVVDQLDSMSTVSGRNVQMWDAFDEMRREVAAYPNMRLLLACRDFDLQHDPRLRTLDGDSAGFLKVSLQTLTHAEIDQSIAAAGTASLVLSPEQYEILKVPFHLLLFLEGDPTRAFTSTGELFDRYWKRKRGNLDTRLGRSSKWNQVIDALTGRMSDDQLLFAPKVVVEDVDAEKDAEGMVSEHVLVDDGPNYRFFHESFFDYAYARRFCASNATLLSLVTASQQHLFRRSQVRQILAYRRANDWRSYLADLDGVLASPDVRFHLKRMIASGMSEVVRPEEDEWKLMEPYLFDDPLSQPFLRALRGHAGWFDLLSSLGVFKEWMQNE